MKFLWLPIILGLCCHAGAQEFEWKGPLFAPDGHPFYWQYDRFKWETEFKDHHRYFRGDLWFCPTTLGNAKQWFTTDAEKQKTDLSYGWYMCEDQSPLGIR
jgi:hypothetical protein